MSVGEKEQEDFNMEKKPKGRWDQWMEDHDTVQMRHYQLAVRVSNAALLHVYDLAVGCSRHAIRRHV